MHFLGGGGKKGNKGGGEITFGRKIGGGGHQLNL